MLISEITSGGLHFVIDKDNQGRARLIHFSSKPFDRENYKEENYSWYHSLIELHMLGCDTNDHHASRHTVTYPAWEMHYVSHQIEKVENGQVLKVFLSNGKTDVCMNYRFYDNASVVRSFAEVTNISEEEQTIDYISSFTFFGLARTNGAWDKETYLSIPHSGCHGELQWKKNSIYQLGLSKYNLGCTKKLCWSQTGTWSSSEQAPMAVWENPGENEAFCWQIENNGSWFFEVGHAAPEEGLYLQLCGPDYEHNHFLKTLKQGETFVSVPVACSVADGGFDEVIGEMTKYRRNIRRKNADNEELPVIFNDYMNCLFADPTTEKELPLIDAAAEAGAEYFVVDAGWFSELEGGDGAWWSSIGVWKESSWRFPKGFIEVMDYIRSKGMKPGLWIEIEGIGPDSEIGKTLPEDWFFQIRGKRTIEHYRWQLDFRNPEVRKFADDTIDEIINKYDLKYLKVDYNINAGLGTDLNAESVGSGLLGHCRAYLEWLDAFLERHPDVVIENCASGGQRMDYAMLSRLSIQSTSDQTHYELYPSISTMAGSAVTPEQAAVWSYPHYEADEEEAVFNMVNAMLGRVHQSGFLNQLPEANFERVKEGIACYKSIRQEIKNALPRFPLGLITFDAPWAAAALDGQSHWYLSVWRKDGENCTQEIPLQIPEGKTAKVECIYPKGLPVVYECDNIKKVLKVTLEEKRRARVFKVEWCE